MMPVVSKMYCSASQVELVVRTRPHMIGGGGFVVMDSRQKQVFRVEGCAKLGTSGEIVLRDENGNALLLIRRKTGGVLQALSIQCNNRWKGYTFDFEGSQRPVFTLKEPNNYNCFARNHPIRISLEPNNKVDSFEVVGYFPDRDCSIVDSTTGNTIAKVGMKKELGQTMEISKDIYHVVVGAGIDQAFVLGVIAVLDHIYGESTAC